MHYARYDLFSNDDTPFQDAENEEVAESEEPRTPILARSDDDTTLRTPHFGFHTPRTGENAAVAIMRSLYADGDAEGALLVATLLGVASASSTFFDGEDPFGGLVPLSTDDELDSTQETEVAELARLGLDVDE